MVQRSTHEALVASITNTAGNIRSTHEALLISVTTPFTVISYPVSPPAIPGIGPQDFTLTEVNVVGQTDSPFTLDQQVQQWPGQMWEIELNLPPMTYVQAEQWIAFLGSLYGRFGTFLMGDYNRPTPQGALGGAPLSSGSNPSQLNSINLRGLTPSVTNWIIAGDYIQLQVPGFPKRLYKAVQNASSSIAGNLTLNIFP